MPRGRLFVGALVGVPLAAPVAVGVVAGLLTTRSAATRTVTVAETSAPTPTAPIDPHVAAGAHDFVEFACAQCHGERGRGGVSSDVPALTSARATAASTATAPAGSAASPIRRPPTRRSHPLSGQDFRTEFNADQKIIAIIRSGSVIGRSPIVSMPHWGGIIRDEQLPRWSPI